MLFGLIKVLKSSFWKNDLSTDSFFGQEGVSSNKKKGDGKAHIGTFKIQFAFRTGDPNTRINIQQITSNPYWISNVNGSEYNRWRERIFSSSADEHLINYSDQYKYAMVIDYNV